MKRRTLSSEDEGGDEPRPYYSKSNPCIEQLLKDIPCYSSGSLEEEEEDDEVEKLQSFGLNVTDDYFVIDGIRNKKGPIPREDGYDITTMDEIRDAESQPFGKKYYDDQLERIRLLNDSNEYKFIKLIAGAMSRSPYDLFDEEDMNRLQQEREEERLKTQLELKRRLVSVEQKDKQLKTLEKRLQELKMKKNDENDALGSQDNDIVMEVEELIDMRQSIDILSDVCDIYDNENENDGNYHRKYYSYSNILGLLTLFDVKSLTQKDMSAIIGLILEGDENDNPLLEPFEKIVEMKDISEVYFFIIYCLYNGNITTFEVFQRLLFDTIDKFGDQLLVKTKALDDLKDSIAPKQSSLALTCTSLFVSDGLASLFDDVTQNKIAKEACSMILGQEKSKGLIKFLDSTTDIGFSITKDNNVPKELRDFIETNKSDLEGIHTKRGLTKRYFIHKWIQRSNWETIKKQMKGDWFDTLLGFATYVRELIVGLKTDLFEPYVKDKMTIVISQMKNVFKRNIQYDDLSSFEKKYKNHNFYSDIKNSKFKQYLDSREYTFKSLLVNSAVHRLLDLYLRYNKFLSRNLDETNETIAQLEKSIAKTRKIIMNLSTEQEITTHRSSSSGSKPDYKQKKSYTSQPSISGIVRLKEEVVTFINRSYTLVQQYCKELRGLPLAGFHCDSAFDSGLACDFAVLIAREIAQNRIIFPESYKTKHHNEKVIIALNDAMRALKKYTYSEALSGGFNISIIEAKLNQRKSGYNESPKFLGSDGIILF